MLLGGINGTLGRKGLIEYVMFIPVVNRIPPSHLMVKVSQPAITCSKLTIETLEPGVKHVQS